MRNTPQVISVLSTEDIARTGEGDIAGALQRVTGLSVVGSGFVYVRGLGDRYSLSLLNGSPLPSPEPLRRVVPLDIFPTSIVASALVQKSYSVNYPAEFGGGVINLTTRAIPTETFLTIGGSISGDNETTGNLGYTYYGSDLDFLGYDNGERSVPAFIREGGTTVTQIPSEQVTRLTNASTTLLQRNGNIPANFSAEANFGTSFDLGAGEIGVIASVGYNNGWRTRDAIQQDTTDPEGALRNDFRTVLTDNRVLVNGLFGLGAEIGEHRFRWTNVYIHDTLKQGRLGTATVYTNSSGDPVLQQNTLWFERQLLNSQLTAEFDFGDFEVDLRGSYAKTDRESPYERFFSYRFDRTRGVYVNSLNNIGEEALISFSDLSEELWSGQIDLSYKLGFGTVSAGYFYSDTERTSSRFDFRYRTNTGGGLEFPYSLFRPDFLLSEDTILNGCESTEVTGPGCIRLFNLSGAEGAAVYDAALTIHGAYAQAEIEFTDALRLTGGLRYETAKESVTTNSETFAGTRLNNDYFLPAATLTWNVAENMQLRLHASKTIARPQFRELAPQIYRDFESDRVFIGNAQLQDSEIDNAEARYEWFFARDQRLTAAAFYKRLKRPIEQVAFFTSLDAPLQTGFSYAPEATLYGAEVEFQKYFPLNWVGGPFFETKRLLLIGNYTYTNSKIKAGEELVPDPIQNNSGVPVLVAANTLFDDGAPLTGQSDHLVNIQIGLEDTDRLSQLTLLFTYASERVTNRGPTSGNLPDLVERPGMRFDLVGREALDFLGLNAELKFEIRNILGEDYEEYQDFDETRVFINRYDVGTTFSLGVSFKL